VLDIRGNVVEVFDLASMLGGMGRDGKTGQIVLVVSLGEHNIGILADAVSDIIDAGPADLREVPANRLRNASDQYVSLLVKHEDRIIAVLNLEALFPNYIA
jgi:purine-binding chemotaxis protein CheW